MSWESHIEDLIAECSEDELKWIKGLCEVELKNYQDMKKGIKIVIDIVRLILKRHKKIAFIVDDSALYVIVEQDLKHLNKLTNINVLDQITIVGVMDNDEFYRINLTNELNEISGIKIVKDNYENKYIDYIDVNKLTVYFKSSIEEDNISVVNDVYEMYYNFEEV